MPISVGISNNGRLLQKRDILGRSKMLKNYQERLPLLDIFRIFICLSIIVYHGAIHKFYVLPGSEFLSHNLLTGAIYMDAFFILSGFLLFLLYGSRFDSISPQISLKEFYLKRYIKIYAQYLALLFVIIAKDGIKYTILPVEILGLQSFFPQLWNYAGNGGNLVYIRNFIFIFNFSFYRILNRTR